MRRLFKTDRIGRRVAAERSRRLGCAIEPMEQRLLMSAITLSTPAVSITDIESKGPFATTFAAVAGSTGNGKSLFNSFEVYEFDAGSPIFPAPSTLNGITALNLTQDSTAITGNFGGVAGSTFNVYLIPNTPAQTPTSSLVFNSDVTGLVGQAGLTSANASSFLLGTIAYTNAATGFGSSTFTASGNATANANLITAENSDQTYRIAVTPATTTSAADYDGNFFSSSPVFTITGTDVPAEQFNLSSASYDVNETAANAYFSVTRTGDVTDAASVLYSTTDGTAVAGTNYTSSAGTLNFVAGQQVATIVVPITNVASQGGNLQFGLSISSPSADTNPVSLGATTSATVTIVDTTPLTNNLSGASSSTSDIETTGSFSTTFLPVVGDVTAGSSSFSFLAYEVLEFDQATTPSIYPALGTTVNSLQNLSFKLFNSVVTGGGNFGGHSGNFDLYFIPGSTAVTSLVFNTSTGDPGGLAGQAGTGPSTLLGVFSFNGATSGYDTFTPAAIPAAVASTLVNDLNTGASFRFALTPGTRGKGAIAADWDGLFSTTSVPVLSFTASETQTANPETLAFQSATYTANETDGTATITLARTGATTDSATVNYATSDGTALAGTNYTASSGTATFAIGATTTSFTVPITDVIRQGGDKVLNLTLSNAASAGPGTIANLGSLTTATLTIKDSSTAPTETLTQFTTDVSDIEKKGPFTVSLFKVEGNSGVSGFPSYGAATFNDSSVFGLDGNPVTFNPANPVTAINSITLDITNGALGTSGPIDIYLVPDTTSNIDPPQAINPHFFDATMLPEGVGTQFGAAVLLGKLNWSGQIAGFAAVNIPLNNYSAATEQTLINDLNNGTKFRIIATPESATVYADWEGVASFDGVSEAPEISFNVQEGPVQPALPPYITASNGAVFTFDSTSGNLSLSSGTLTFTADSTTDTTDPLVNLTATGPTANVVFNTTQHIAGLTLAGGATASIVSGAGATLNTAALAINTGSTLDITTNKVVVTFAPGADPATSLVTSLSVGYHGGSWTGTGITSSAAAANPSKFAVGYLDGGRASDNLAGTAPSNQFIMKYVLAGDAFIENSVGFDDLVVVAQNFGFTGEDWAGGNFNYDPSGSVGFSDLVNVAQNFGFDSGVAAAAPITGTMPLSGQSAKHSVVVNPQSGVANTAAAASLLADDSLDSLLGAGGSPDQALE